MIDLNEMFVFARVAQAQSITGGAKALGIPKSSVSRKIAQLESRLGVRLLHRTTRRLSLTEIGAAYYERCARVLAQAEEAEQAVSQLRRVPQGRLRITTTVEYGLHRLAEHVEAYLKRYPQVAVEVILTSRVVDLVQEGIDIAIRFGQLEDSGLGSRKLGAGQMLLYASPGYLRKNGTPKSIEDLSKHKGIHFQDPYPEPIWPLNGPGGETRRIGFESRYASNNLSLVHDACARGFGIALMPPFVCEDSVREGRLVQVLSGWGSGDDAIHAVFPSQRYLAPKVRAFLDLIAKT